MGLPFKKLILGNEKVLNLTTNGRVDKVSLYLSSPMQKLGEFSRVNGTRNKFVYNWTDIQTLLEPYYTTGDEIEIIINVFDSSSKINDTLRYTCLLDFEPPEIKVRIGDGATNYSSSNCATPWTRYTVNNYDNLENILNHSHYYYSEILRNYFQVKVFEISNNLVCKTGFIPLDRIVGNLNDLDIPIKNYENPDEYYYVAEFKTVDAAGNVVINSSYLGNVCKLFASNELFIEFNDNLIDVNELFQNNSDFLNFTLIDANQNIVMNASLFAKSGDYYLKNPIWNESTQTYYIEFENTFI